KSKRIARGIRAVYNDLATASRGDQATLEIRLRSARFCAHEASHPRDPLVRQFSDLKPWEGQKRLPCARSPQGSGCTVASTLHAGQLTRTRARQKRGTALALLIGRSATHSCQAEEPMTICLTSCQALPESTLRPFAKARGVLGRCALGLLATQLVLLCAWGVSAALLTGPWGVLGAAAFAAFVAAPLQDGFAYVGRRERARLPPHAPLPLPLPPARCSFLLPDALRALSRRGGRARRRGCDPGELSPDPGSRPRDPRNDRRRRRGLCSGTAVPGGGGGPGAHPVGARAGVALSTRGTAVGGLGPGEPTRTADAQRVRPAPARVPSINSRTARCHRKVTWPPWYHAM